jgi:DNA-directed RNA polymerase subunit omega
MARIYGLGAPVGRKFLLPDGDQSLPCAALSQTKATSLNSDYVRQAQAKVGNPNVLINLVSRRVRQLNGGGGNSRPLIADTATLGVADIALLEIIEGKMGWSADGIPEVNPSPTVAS